MQKQLTKTVKNEFAEIWIEKGILYFVYAPMANLRLSLAKKLVKLRLSIQKTKKYPVLCDLRNVIQADPEAMNYLAKEGAVQITAVALLGNYPHTKAIAEFYLSTSAPKIPTKIFEDKDKAIEFLSFYTTK